MNHEWRQVGFFRAKRACEVWGLFAVGFAIFPRWFCNIPPLAFLEQNGHVMFGAFLQLVLQFPPLILLLLSIGFQIFDGDTENGDDDDECACVTHICGDMRRYIHICTGYLESAASGRRWFIRKWFWSLESAVSGRRW